MSNILKYKEYIGTVEYSSEDDCLYGKVIGLNDSITFEGSSIDELKADFHNAVDDYLELCAEQGKEPEKAYKGTFNVRIKPELHKKAVLLASEQGKTLNTIVEEAIINLLKNTQAEMFYCPTDKTGNKFILRGEKDNENCDICPPVNRQKRQLVDRRTNRIMSKRMLG